LRIRNPSSISNTALVYVYTANSDKVVDIGYSAEFSPVASALLKASASASSLISSDLNVDYNFSVQPNGPIPQNAAIKVVLPPQVTVSDINSIETECGVLPAAGIPLSPLNDT
jgi:UDP-3-O-[3-hydroxymyristoyl] glucosamine N-acyltransferase